MGFFFWFGTAPVVSMLTDDQEVVDIAVMINRMLIPGMVILWLYTAVRLYMHGLKTVLGTTVGGISAVFFNIIATKLLVDGIPSIGFMGFAVSGAAWAINFSFVFQFLVCCLVSLVLSKKLSTMQAWDGWSMEAITMERFATFSKLAAPLALAGCAESWGNRIMVMARSVSPV